MHPIIANPTGTHVDVKGGKNWHKHQQGSPPISYLPLFDFLNASLFLSSFLICSTQYSPLLNSLNTFLFISYPHLSLLLYSYLAFPSTLPHSPAILSPPLLLIFNPLLLLLCPLLHSTLLFNPLLSSSHSPLHSSSSIRSSFSSITPLFTLRSDHLLSSLYCSPPMNNHFSSYGSNIKLTYSFDEWERHHYHTTINQ